MDPISDHVGQLTDPLSGLIADVRFVHPYRANKIYICPLCNQEILHGIGHYVVVPFEAPDLRRHWHRQCWQRRTRYR
ncbi:hypothetical protein [Ferrithrix thermotolerans]|uniref:hypothetical protein n=1 Tax=Ferrithrix thermotolerans TaxID=209649 RepID=UPI00093471E4|nr:hypothetical protein [Ferrithrix thermotolerans]